VSLLSTHIYTLNYTEATTNTWKPLGVLKQGLNVVIMPAACGLFFIRVRTVYRHDKHIIIFFGFGWVVTLTFFLLDSTGDIMQYFGLAQPTHFYPHMDALAYISTAVFDTLMYLFISWRLASFATIDRWQDRLRLFVTGNGLGWLSKVLLQSGQIYYL
jgi:hypothetical protein